MFRLSLLVLLLVVFTLGASLGYFNAEPVHFHYLFGAVDVRLAVLVILSFLAGALLAVLFCGIRILSLVRELRRARKQFRDAETELKNLRNLPAASDRRF